MAVEAVETIGARRRRLAPTQQPLPSRTFTFEPRSRPLVGRHTAAYIRSQGETPVSIAEIRGKTTQSSARELPQTSSVLPQRIPKVALREEIAAAATPVPADLQVLSLQSPGTLAHTEPLPPAQTDIPKAVVISISEAGNSEPIADPDAPKPEIRTHRTNPRRPRRRRMVAAAAAIVTGLAALGGGLQMMKDNKTPSPTQKTSVELSVPDYQQPPLQEPKESSLQISEVGKISDQDHNGWGHSASKTQAALDRDHSLVGVTNIVSKVGAYDSLGTSPDPDAAKPGDTMITLTKPAIQTVDRLQNTVAPDASEAEKEAAKIIKQLNSLDPMETKAFVEHYGTEIEALKQDLSTILGEKQAITSSQSPIRTEAVAATADKKIVTAAKATTIFSRVADRISRIHSPGQVEQVNKGKKAISGLAKDQRSRQRQPSFA